MGRAAHTAIGYQRRITMDNRIKRGVLVVVFSLLVYLVGSVPAAYAVTVPLNLWNNSASSGTVLVVISPITATSGTITLSFGDPVDARATIDKFFWNGTATLTYKTGIG